VDCLTVRLFRIDMSASTAITAHNFDSIVYIVDNNDCIRTDSSLGALADTISLHPVEEHLIICPQCRTTTHTASESSFSESSFWHRLHTVCDIAECYGRVVTEACILMIWRLEVTTQNTHECGELAPAIIASRARAVACVEWDGPLVQ
jgi:hypothetical protein